MFKRIAAALILAPTLMLAAEGDGAPASTEQSGPKFLSFEVGTAIQFGKGEWNRGNGYNFAINIPTKALTLGYYFEQLNATAESNDDGDADATHVDGKLSLHEIRAIKSIPGTKDMLGIGLGVGMGDLTTSLQGGGGNTNQQQATVGDLFIKFAPLSGGDSLKASLNVIAGYRFVRFSGISLDNNGGDFNDDTDNLDGLRLGLSVDFGF